MSIQQRKLEPAQGDQAKKNAALAGLLPLLREGWLTVTMSTERELLAEFPGLTPREPRRRR
jgi:hypothetical protein